MTRHNNRLRLYHGHRLGSRTRHNSIALRLKSGIEDTGKDAGDWLDENLTDAAADTGPDADTDMVRNLIPYHQASQGVQRVVLVFVALSGSCCFAKPLCRASH